MRAERWPGSRRAGSRGLVDFMAMRSGGRGSAMPEKHERGIQPASEDRARSVLKASERVALRQAFGQRLQGLRSTELGLSEAQVADRCGLSRATIGKIERGQREPSLCMILIFCRALGVSPGELLEGLLPDRTERARRGQKGAHG